MQTWPDVHALEGQVALITGGSSGIGLASARQFAAQGAQVVITGRNQDAVDSDASSFVTGINLCVEGGISLL